mmetsp:Transcript_39953/g.113215  ORF Transcript_39953/g.113215 Transcript_39953/m.113215 type:complete len:216 (-) Transcript_39953:1395-2042(-)
MRGRVLLGVVLTLRLGLLILLPSLCDALLHELGPGQLDVQALQEQRRPHDAAFGHAELLHLRLVLLPVHLGKRLARRPRPPEVGRDLREPLVQGGPQAGPIVGHGADEEGVAELHQRLAGELRDLPQGLVTDRHHELGVRDGEHAVGPSTACQREGPELGNILRDARGNLPEEHLVSEGDHGEGPSDIGEPLGLERRDPTTDMCGQNVQEVRMPE